MHDAAGANALNFPEKLPAAMLRASWSSQLESELGLYAMCPSQIGNPAPPSFAQEPLLRTVRSRAHLLSSRICASRTLVPLQPALPPREQSFIRQPTTGRLPSRKSLSIPIILIQTTTTQEFCEAPIRFVHPVPLSPSSPPSHPAQTLSSDSQQPVACHPENPYQSR